MINKEIASRVKRWYEREYEELESRRQNLEEGIDYSPACKGYPIVPPLGKGKTPEDYLIAVSMVLKNQNIEILENYDSLQKYYPILLNEINDFQTGFKISGGYYNRRDYIRILSFPNNYFKRENPKILEPLIKSIETEEPEKSLNETLLHEGTHAFLNENVAHSNNQDLKAVDEAAARAVSAVVNPGNDSSPASQYRERFDVEKMQTAEYHFHKFADGKSKEKAISDVRKRAMDIEREQVSNPERDLISIISSGTANNQLESKIRNIHSTLYLFEKIEIQLYSFLAELGLIDRKGINNVQEIDEIIHKIDNRLVRDPNIAKLDEMGQNLINDLSDELEDIEASNTGHLPILEELRNIIDEINSIDQEIDAILEELEQDNLFRKYIRKIIGRTSQDIINHRKELREIEKELQNIVEDIDNEKELKKQINSVEQNLESQLTSSEITNILTNSNRLKPGKLKQEEKQIDEIFLESLESYKTVVNTYLEINSDLIETLQKLNGEMKLEKEWADIDSKQGINKINKVNAEKSEKSKLKSFLEEISEERRATKEILDASQDIQKISKTGQKRANECKSYIQKAEEKLGRLN